MNTLAAGRSTLASTCIRPEDKSVKENSCNENVFKLPRSKRSDCRAGMKHGKKVYQEAFAKAERPKTT